MMDIKRRAASQRKEAGNGKRQSRRPRAEGFDRLLPSAASTASWSSDSTALDSLLPPISEFNSPLLL
ncbi:unnamed protein product [Cuscuta campestris]|uniref:Uncharacterized protein n=1 Tax=Cuscuta campestris TaxID=132261 RepID=A0A484NBX5_9ASTE|nr:unnamed protein product [Cuscuta campestris]